MNAPADPMQLAAELVPVDTIVPSDTHIQQLRRKRFDETGLLELAASIQSAGVINPILVRPFAGTSRDGHVTPTPKYELVAGERRWLATKRAGFAHVPTVIRELDDGDVLVAQMIENKQRDDYTPLEEAAGYNDLKDIKHWDAQEIADHIGKSKSYVYARLKLTALSDPARQALEVGKLDYSKALLLARIHSPKLQEKALKVLTEENWRGEPVSYRVAFDTLREKFMLPLAGAPFGLDDAQLFKFTKVRKGVEDAEALPICTTCPHNSANDAELQRDLKSDAHVCTNTECFELKVVALHGRRRQEAEAEKRPIVTGEEAKKIFPSKHAVVGYIDLDTPCESDAFEEDEPRAKDANEEDTPAFQAKLDAWEAREQAFRPRTYRQLLGEHKLEVTLAEDPKTKKLRELVPVNAARKLLVKQHEIKLPGYVGKPEPARPGGSQPFDHAAYQRQQEEQRQRQERERNYRIALAQAIAAKCAGPLTREDLVDVADQIADDWTTKQGLKYIYGTTPEPGQLKDAELGKFIRLALIAPDILRTNQAAIHAMAKRYKVDAAKIKAELDGARKAKAEPKAEAPAKAKAAAKKATAKKKAAKK